VVEVEKWKRWLRNLFVSLAWIGGFLALYLGTIQVVIYQNRLYPERYDAPKEIELAVSMETDLQALLDCYREIGIYLCEDRLLISGDSEAQVMFLRKWALKLDERDAFSRAVAEIATWLR